MLIILENSHTAISFSACGNLSLMEYAITESGMEVATGRFTRQTLADGIAFMRYRMRLPAPQLSPVAVRLLEDIRMAINANNP